MGALEVRLRGHAGATTSGGRRNGVHAGIAYVSDRNPDPPRDGSLLGGLLPAAAGRREYSGAGALMGGVTGMIVTGLGDEDSCDGTGFLASLYGLLIGGLIGGLAGQAAYLAWE